MVYCDVVALKLKIKNNNFFEVYINSYYIKSPFLIISYGYFSVIVRTCIKFKKNPVAV